MNYLKSLPLQDKALYATSVLALIVIGCLLVQEWMQWM